MTPIEKAVKTVSNLRDFYHRIPKIPPPAPPELRAVEKSAIVAPAPEAQKKES